VGITYLFLKKIKKIKKIIKIVAFRGNSGNSGGDGGREEGREGVLNSNHRGTGWEETSGYIGERVPWVPRGIPTDNTTFF
jgi:hypothetical protein